MKNYVILGSLVAGLILSSCNSSNRVVSNFYEDGIYYNPAIGNIPSGSLAGGAEASNEKIASAVNDYFDPNYKSQGPTIINNHYGTAFSPMWGMGFSPLCSPWIMNPMWMSPGWSFGLGWGAGWGMGWSRWGLGFGPTWANNPWYWNPWMMNRMWRWDPWLYSPVMMWDPFWGHPMAWGNPWINPWMPGFGWGIPVVVLPPRPVNQVRGVRTGSYASTGSGIGRKSSESSLPANQTSRLSAARTSAETAAPSAQPVSRLESVNENPSSRLRASDLRATRDVVTSSQTISRNSYTDRLSTNTLQASSITRPVESRAPISRPSPANIERPARIYTPSSNFPVRSTQNLPATRQYQRGQMESIQSRPLHRQPNTWQNQAPATRPNFNHGGARQFNSSPSFNSGGATRGSSGSTGGRLR